MKSKLFNLLFGSVNTEHQSEEPQLEMSSIQLLAQQIVDSAKSRKKIPLPDFEPPLEIDNLMFSLESDT